MKLIITREENDYEENHYFLKLIIPENYIEHFTTKTKYLVNKYSFCRLLNFSEDQFDSCLVDLHYYMDLNVPMFTSLKSAEIFKDRLEATLILNKIAK